MVMLFCDIWMTSQFVAYSCDNSVVVMVTQTESWTSVMDESRKRSTLVPAGQERQKDIQSSETYW